MFLGKVTKRIWHLESAPKYRENISTYIYQVYLLNDVDVPAGIESSTLAAVVPLSVIYSGTKRRQEEEMC